MEAKQSSVYSNSVAITPFFSVIIAAYNDWLPLAECLKSLQQQTDAPSFEVVVIDDGSREAAPEFICNWSRLYPLRIARQAHAGISAARNRGVQMSTGSTLIFVDADCRFEIGCLARLGSLVSQSPHSCFQLHVVGDRSGLVGKAEELRLATLQSYLIQPDGCIRYLNTAGFAIRREKVNANGKLFNPAALRAEDTLLLAMLMKEGRLPFFVNAAVVQHVIPLSLMECLRKDIWSAYLEGKTYHIIASNGISVRVSHRDRLKMLSVMWRTSRQQSLGYAAWFVLVARQALQRLISYGYHYFGPPLKRKILSAARTNISPGNGVKIM